MISVVNMAPFAPPRWPQVGPTMVPKSVWGAHGAPWVPMDPLWALSEADFGSILVRFWRFLINFVTIFGRCLVAVGCILT